MDLLVPSFLIDKAYSPYFITGYEPWWVFSANKTNATFKIDSREYVVYGNVIEEFTRILKKYLIPDSIAVGYLSYNLGEIIEEIGSNDGENSLIFFAGFKNYQKVRKTNILKELQNKSINYFNPLQNKLEVISIMPFEIYSSKIEKIKKYIEEGEVYQVNFSYRQVFEFSGNLLELYLRLSKIAKPAHGFYLDTGGIKILSLSPERFFRIRDGIIESFPIKGTIERGRTRAMDIQNRLRLSKSVKDRAEHLMIVDLLRNDLGRICKTGSVKVDGLFSVQSYRTVHHMVSRIYGSLEKNISFADIVRAIFPGGSITGAPKIRAMQIINQLEDYSRGVYTGAIGYILPDGSADFNIAIRTLVVNEKTAYYSVGGGIVYDSDPLKEYEETKTKSKIIEKVIEELENEKNNLSQRRVASGR